MSRQTKTLKRRLVGLQYETKFNVGCVLKAKEQFKR